MTQHLANLICLPILAPKYSGNLIQVFFSLIKIGDVITHENVTKCLKTKVTGYMEM